MYLAFRIARCLQSGCFLVLGIVQIQTRHVVPGRRHDLKLPGTQYPIPFGRRTLLLRFMPEGGAHSLDLGPQASSRARMLDPRSRVHTKSQTTPRREGQQKGKPENQ